MAAFLASKGFNVNLADLPEFGGNIKPFQTLGGIEISGELSGLFKPNLITTNIQEAIKGVDMILIISRAQGHIPLIESCLPYLQNGQALVVYTPFWTSLRVVNELRERGLRDVILGEVSILPWSCNRTGPTNVYLRTTKRELLVAAIPTKYTGRLIDMLNKMPAPPKYVPAVNVLETSLANIMPELVVPIPLLNIGFTEFTKVSLYYEYGLSPPVGRVVDALDNERLAIGKALGLDLAPFPEIVMKWYSQYGAKGKSSFEVFNTLWTHKWEVPATTLQQEIEKGELAESVPNYLVPLASLGDLLGVPTPATDTIIHLAEMITGVNYRREGFTVGEMGLAALSAEQIIRYANTGEK